MRLMQTIRTLALFRNEVDRHGENQGWRTNLKLYGNYRYKGTSNCRRYLNKMPLLTIRNVLHLLAMITFLHIGQARSFTNDGSSSANTTDTTDRLNVMWKPKQGTREEWMACRGMPKDVCERIKVKKQELQRMLAMKVGLGDIGNSTSFNDSGVNQCTMFTEKQLDMMMTEIKQEENATSTHRMKRSLIDLKEYPDSMWSMPVPYMFDGDHDYKQIAKIRGAFQHWADNTCIRFRELPTNDDFDSNYILIIGNESDGCWSYLGKSDEMPQLMNLGSGCVQFGTILHEIGHSLGLVHEQSRIDRNDSIRILWNNIQMEALSQYEQASFTDALGLPYNYGSVMHYSSKNSFAESSKIDTMIALEPLYQMNMGQSVDLSFNDRKIINLAYCKGTCATPLTQPCQRGGYQNPNNCSTCICPDGFAGQHCSGIAQPKNASCGGILNIASGTQQVIESPGYDTTGYSEHQECTWWIKAPNDYTLQLTFKGNFSIFCYGSSCEYHWVEIKYKKDLGLEGARFCCYNRPNETVFSDSNEMMVIFRSNYSLSPRWKIYQRGFQAIVKTVKIPQANRPTSTPVSNVTGSGSASASIFGTLLLITLLQLVQLLLLKLPLALRRV